MRARLFAITLILITALVLGGCSVLLPQNGEEPGSQDAAFTQAAQTIVAEFTQNAVNTAVAQATAQATHPAPAQPTPTELLPQTGGATPTATLPAPSATLPPPTPTNTPPPPSPTAVPCNRAEFVGDVSVPDGASFAPGAEFTKIWRLRNNGACTWNSSYSLVFVDGDNLSGRSSFPLSGNVRPGETVDVAVNLRAPDRAGRYRGEWMLRSPEGQFFGIGARADATFWVSIRVIALPPVNRDFSYDFVGNLCAAAWRSGSGPVACPGAEGDAGWVTFLERPELEDGRRENEPALLTRPEASRGGWISGTYPSYRVRPGDRFITQVGCLEGSRGCELTFSLDYQIGSEPVRNLGSWREVYDGQMTLVDLDLSQLAGYDVKFILSVVNHGRPGAAEAVWFVPSIRQKPVTGPGYENIPAVVAARTKVAQSLGVDPKEVVITFAEPRTWSDSCLGVKQPEIVCSDVVVNGYRVVLWWSGREYEAHTNEDGSVVVWFEY